MIEATSSGEIRNPHYTKTVLLSEQEKEGHQFALCKRQAKHENNQVSGSSKTDPHCEEGFPLTISTKHSCQTQQSIAQHSLYTVTDDDTNKDSDTHKENFVNHQKESTSSHHEPPQYAVVNKEKNKSRSLKSKQLILPTEGEITCHSDSTLIRDTIISKKVEYYSAPEAQERSPSPVYAEPVIDQEKLAQASRSAIEGRRPSPEYADDASRRSKGYTIEVIPEDEQHYYHSLECPIDNVVTEGNIGHKSKDYTVQSTVVGEQHYYHSLECQVDNNVNEGCVSNKSKYYKVQNTEEEEGEQHYYHSLEGPKQPILPTHREHPQDNIILTRDTITSKKVEYYSAQEMQERSPSPVYAEPSIDKKKLAQASSVEMLVKKQGDLAIEERSASPEYAEVDDASRHSKGYTIDAIGEGERHYYHSLEEPIDSEVVTKRNIGHNSKDYTVKSTVEQHYYHSLECPNAGNISGNNNQ